MPLLKKKYIIYVFHKGVMKHSKQLQTPIKKQSLVWWISFTFSLQIDLHRGALNMINLN